MAENKGKWGEELAINYLRKHDFTILEVNWRYKKLEVDIIAENEQKIVFIEVKTRGSDEFGEPETFVSLKKQRFIVEAANNYMIEKNRQEEARFDIVSILVKNNLPVIKHLPDAFYPIVK
jgi:putative endonuclease